MSLFAAIYVQCMYVCMYVCVCGGGGGGVMSACMRFVAFNGLVNNISVISSRLQENGRVKNIC